MHVCFGLGDILENSQIDIITGVVRDSGTELILSLFHFFKLVILRGTAPQDG